jgi:D-Tyr-tRNAtyr deacylase
MERRKIISVAFFSAAIAGGGVAGVILGSPASVSAATAAPTTSTPKGAHRFGSGRGMGDGPVLDAAAKAIGVSTDTLRTDLKNGQTIAQVAKSKNVATQTVIDAMVAAAKKQLASEEATLESHLTDMITNEVNGTLKRPDAPNGENGPQRGFGFRGGFGLDAAAKAIGVSEQTLQTDLKNGQTIAQVAKSKNVSTQKVIDAMVASAKSQLESQVKAGHLSSDMEKKIESQLPKMITNQVNGTFARPSFRGAPGYGWHGQGGGGRGGPGGYGPPGGTGNSNGSGSATQSSAPAI